MVGLELDDVLSACEHLTARGIAPLSFFGEPITEPSVIGSMPAAAIYFPDPDGHRLEYVAMVGHRPDPVRGIVPWTSREASQARYDRPGQEQARV